MNDRLRTDLETHFADKVPDKLKESMSKSEARIVVNSQFEDQYTPLELNVTTSSFTEQVIKEINTPPTQVIEATKPQSKISPNNNSILL